MKKLTFAALVAVLATGLWSCGNGVPKANLKSDIDTASYALGMAQSQGLKEYMVHSLGVDTNYMDEFYKGLMEGANAGDDKGRSAYYAGIQIGQQISNQMVRGINYQLFGEDSTQTISLKNFMAGFINGTEGRGLMTIDNARMVANMKMMEIRRAATIKQYEPNRKEGEKYLAKYAKGEGVKTLEGGVLYKVLVEGNGATPTDTSSVQVYYEGKLIDGTVFDSHLSDKFKEPITLRANQVIKGWQTVLSQMPVGSKWEVVIPQDLAYGDREQGKIKPYSALVFTVELVGIGK